MPQPFDQKPYTLFKGGDQFGRDQLANRFLVADKMLPLTGFSGNEVLTILGQPTTVQEIQKGQSQDWRFSYYKKYKTLPKTEVGYFVIRFYHDKVIDMVKEA